MKYVGVYCISFIIIYLFYLFTVVLQKKRMNKFKRSNQIMFFVNRYNLDVDKINMTKFTNLLGIVNAFIMSTAFISMYLANHILIQFLIGLAVLLPLLLVSYHIIGKVYGSDKDV